MSVISTLSLDAQKSYYNSEIICESKITEQHTTPETKASLIIWCKYLVERIWKVYSVLRRFGSASSAVILFCEYSCNTCNVSI